MVEIQNRPWIELCNAALLGLLLMAAGSAACDRPVLHSVLGRASPTDSGCAPRGVPRSLEAQVAEGAILVSWLVTSADGDGFIVERSDGVGLAWGEVGRTAAGVLSYNDATVATDDEYFYRVRAFRLQGSEACESAASDAIAVLSRPTAPVDLSHAFPEAGSVTLTWSDANDHESGYRIERSEGGGSFAEIASLGADVTTFTDSGRSASTTYEYRVYAFNASGDSLAATRSVRMPGPPVLSWGSAPSVDDACWLQVPGVADLAEGLDLQSASGMIGKASGAVTADETGISATLTDLSVGMFSTSWTLTDSIAGTDTLSRDLALGVRSVTLTGARAPAIVADEDAMIGRQADLAGCKTCTGKRGSIAAGVSHSCVVTSTGAVLCWGDGTYGALGNGYDDALASPAATCGGPAGDLCSQPFAASSVVTGGSHSCAIAAGGALFCWGGNYDGGLGDGTTSARATPTPVCITGTTDTGNCVQLTGVTSVSLGSSHSCALVAGGNVYCWGDNSSGKLGDGTTVDRLNPTLVCATGSTDTADCVGLAIGLPGVVQVSLGDEHSCAVTTGHAIKCWGSNYWSQLGLGHVDGDSDDHPNPISVCPAPSAWNGTECNDGVPVSPLGGVGSVSAGALHTCVVLTGGELRCWGDDRSGQLGDASNATWSWRDNPVRVCEGGSEAAGTCAPLTGATRVASGTYHTCAIVGAGNDAYCWGANYEGRLGDGTTSDRANPTRVCVSGSTDTADCVGLASVAALDVGDGGGCAQKSDGSLLCWGSNGSSQLGLGVGNSTVDHATNPGSVCMTGSGGACAAATGASSLTVRQESVCAIVAGNVRCWGENGYAQAGIGGAEQGLPASVCASGAGADCVPLTGARAVVAGDGYSCALMDDGGAKCWGLNPDGVLGNGTTDTVANPVDVCASGNWDGSTCTDGGTPSRQTGLVALAAGWQATCAITDAGAVVCWGRNEYGVLGDGTAPAWSDLAATPKPVCVTGFGGSCVPLVGAVSVAVHDNHACALLGTGRVVCWGNNQYGQLGNNTPNAAYNPTPVCAAGTDPANCAQLAQVEMLALGWQHSCALVRGGQARCWGRRLHGQLGDGYAADDMVQNAVPVCASGAGPSCPPLPGVVAIAAGFEHSCALLGSGGVACWGEGSFGALGDGTWVGYDVPLPLPRPVCAPDAGLTCGDGSQTCGAASSGLVAVSTYGRHVCALSQDAEAVCWGYNYDGQLGNGVVPGYDDGSCVPVPVCESGSGGSCPAFSGFALRTCDLVSVSVP